MVLEAERVQISDVLEAAVLARVRLSVDALEQPMTEIINEGKLLGCQLWFLAYTGTLNYQKTAFSQSLA